MDASSTEKGETDGRLCRKKWSLLDLERAQLQELLGGWDEPAFRTEQIWNWLYRRAVLDVDGLANLPAGLRARLAQEAWITPLVRVKELISRDNQTEKCLFRLPDGALVESVLMHYERRHTVCVSTQVGCPVGCPFCATGQGGFVRDLSVGEIVAQVLHFAPALAERNSHITNVVFMGMGEPLLNYAAVLRAIATLTEPSGLAISPQQVTVSTIGLPERIVALAGAAYPVRLAVSLHGPDDDTRALLVPYARQVPLEKLMAACRTYAQVRASRVTFEYVMAAGVNDSPEHARRLLSLIGSMSAHINLIPLNPVPGCDLNASSLEVMERFREPLTKARIPVTIRYSRGVSIGAGCGQLRGTSATARRSIPHRQPRVRRGG